MDTDGGNPTNLTNTPGFDQDPDWQRLPVASCAEVVNTIEDLAECVRELELHFRSETSLLAKLDAASADVAAGDTSGACEALQDFSKEVRAQRYKKIAAADADRLIASAQAVRARLGC